MNTDRAFRVLTAIAHTTKRDADVLVDSLNDFEASYRILLGFLGNVLAKRIGCPVEKKTKYCPNPTSTECLTVTAECWIKWAQEEVEREETK